MTQASNRRLPGRRGGIVAAGLAILLLSTALASPGPARAESLADALAAAYKFNPRLDADRARQRAQDEEVARANSGYRPTVTGTGQIGYQRSDTKPQSTTDGETHPKNYSVNAQQPIFRGFRTLNQVRQAEALVRAGRETLRSTEQSVLLDAVTAYMNVVRDQAILRLRENNVNVLTRELKATQDRFSVGEVTRTDVAQAETRRADAVASLEVARASLRNSRANFERVIGNPPSNLQQQRPPLRLLPKTLEEAIAITLREAPAVVNALYTEQAARHTVDLIWGELLPTVTLNSTYTRSFDTSRTVDENQTTTVLGQVTVPIYPGGGEVHARVRQAKHTHVQRLQDVETQRTLAREATVSAWSNYNAAKAQLDANETSVRGARTALAGVREEERVGQRTLLDVLNAERDLVQAEVTLVQTQRDYIVQSYTLLQAIGRLGVAEVGVTDQVYDPNAHYSAVRRQWWGISITYSNGRKESHDLWETHGERYESENAEPGVK